jgi:hypothetical protein
VVRYRSCDRFSGAGSHRGQLDRDLGADQVQRRGLRRAVSLVNIPEMVTAKRRSAGQEVIEGTAEAVDVGTSIGRLGVADLLGGNVIGRAQHLALTGQVAVGLTLACDLGQAEIEHLHDGL